MKNITYKTLKFEYMIAKTNNRKSYNLCCCCCFEQDRFFRFYQFYCNTAFIISSIKKDCLQDHLSFVFLRFYKHNCLNVLAGNNCFRIEVKKSIEMTVKDSHSILSSDTFSSRKLV